MGYFSLSRNMGYFFNYLGTWDIFSLSGIFCDFLIQYIYVFIIDDRPDATCRALIVIFTKYIGN